MKGFDMLTEVDMKRIKKYEALSEKIKDLQKEIEDVKAELAREKEDRQYDNLVHKQELEKLFKLDGSG